jgi:recombination associated protein RdgC
MFKNVRFLRLTSPWPGSEQALDEALASASFAPCGPFTEKTSGWEPPIENAGSAHCRRVGGADLMQLRHQSRLLPAAAINEAVEARLEEFRSRMGEMPGRREKRRMKLETRDNLMPKALLRSERTRGFFLESDGLLAIDAASPVRTERFLEMLRMALGKLDVSELEFKRPVSDLLTRIFLGDPLPGIRLGRECRMKDPADSKATVRFADMDLTGASIRKHVRDGLQLTHLGIEFQGIMSCSIDENGGLGKLKLLGMDAREASDAEDPLARLDAEFVLLTGTLRQFLGVLGKALGGTAERQG